MRIQCQFTDRVVLIHNRGENLTIASRDGQVHVFKMPKNWKTDWSSESKEDHRVL